MVTKRVKIVTGFHCNARCLFCYYRDRLHESNRPKEAVIRDLVFARAHGIDEIDFSGGEPTTHEALADLIREAKRMGFRKVSIITNGLKLASEPYYRALREAGLDETLFSMQGGEEASHDQFTSVPGAFASLLQAMAIAKKIGIRIRINTVVHKLNYRHLRPVLDQAILCEAVQVNFITVNDWRYAHRTAPHLICRYTDMSPYLKEACDVLTAAGIGNVNVRYIPFCAMGGYEKFVCDHAQVKYDPYEWLPHVRVPLETNISRPMYAAMILFGLLAGGTLWHLGRIPKGDRLDRTIIAAIRAYNYAKHPRCRACRFDALCDGVEKSYAKIFGLEECRPVPGEKVREWDFFR